MAIIVNKEEKRRAIALASTELLLENGIKNITIAKIAECAGVGKGTIYEYFSNKEDIVFEIISVFIAEHEKELYRIVDEPGSTKEKVKEALVLIFSTEETRKQLSLYMEFIAISLTSNVDEMIDFSRACRQRFMTVIGSIFNQAIEKGEFDMDAKSLASMLHTYHLGLVVDSKMHNIDALEMIDAFVETFFTLIGKKES